MSCNNCFNGCAETTSDQCVKYTGVNIPLLEIANGDSLASVESSLATYLLSALDGTGIVPYIDNNSLCSLVNSFLPVSGPITLNDIVDTFINCICSLQAQVTAVTNDMATLNSEYTISCLTGVVATDDTHDILQATITKLCGVSASVTALALDLSTNYVPVSEINDYIAAYLESIGSSTLIGNKMVPNTAVEFWGDITGKFDVSGAGIGDWINVYLCNGNNGTPDKRGRVGVGVTTGMGGGAFDANVNPAISGNPTYTLGIPYGNNTVTLGLTQIPSHTHIAHVTEVPHSHAVTFGSAKDANQTGSSNTWVQTGTGTDYTTSAVSTGVTVTNDPTGQGAAHPNVQPVLPCYYIIYLP